MNYVLMYFCGATSVAIPAGILLREMRRILATALERTAEVEDKMLILADRPDAVIEPQGGGGKVTYMDEAKEAQLDAATEA